MNAAQAIQKLRQVIRRQHKALATKETYVLWLRRYMAAVRQMPNSLPSEQKLERFLTELAHQVVAASTQHQAFNAVAFFYKDVLGLPSGAVDALRVKRPEKGQPIAWSKMNHTMG
jgi:Phage integrase, N-terminal SAM-like domain